MSAVALWLARIGFAVFALATSFYCLLAFVPFTYHHFLRFSHLAWLSAFARHHAALYWLVLAAVAVTLREDLLRNETRRLTAAFLALHVAAGVALGVHPLLPTLANDAWSFVFALVAPLSLAWIAVIDLLGHRGESTAAKSLTGEEWRLFGSAVLAALGVSLLFFVQATSRENGAAAEDLAWSVVSHLVLFTALFVVATLVRSVAGFSSQPVRAELWLGALAVGAVAFRGLRDVVLAAISLRDRPADVYAAVVAGSLALFLVGLGTRLSPHRGGLGTLFVPLVPAGTESRVGLALWIVIAASAIGGALPAIAANDWNFLAQETAVVVTWAAALGVAYAFLRHPRAARERTGALLLASLAVLGVHRLLASRAGEVEGALDRYAGVDPSFRVTRQILAPPRSDDGFFRFLQRSTNIPRTTPVEPVEVKLVDRLERRPGTKPHVFLIVIDSLRQDYLSPYDPAVGFTPAIASFAAESIVMKNAFTRYGATGLSEPSIWVGGMMLHLQYVTPFHSMNALERLIEHEGYEGFISLDTILRVILRSETGFLDVDAESPDKEFELCRSLQRLEAAIDRRRDPARPIFAYTQPQNLHVSVLNREGRTVPEGEEYPGFFAPYASRLRRMDACFGDFIRHLEEHGLYDESIIVLTSDHGDSLGEEGRWGHAYTIFPEVLRIPLIVHLPARMREGLSIDPEEVAFSTDLTPSLYYLLGHRPIVDDEIFGRPLFTTTRDERPRRDSWLVGSSYGPVYGLLGHGGRSLYVADAVNYTESFYDLAAGFLGRRAPVTPRIREESRRRIRERILAIDRFYGYSPPDEG